jgi:hypothetical protein
MSPFVFDEAELPELVQEDVDPRPRGAHHFGERFLADFRDDRLRLSFLGEIRHQEKEPRQAFLASIEKLIDQIGFDPGIPRQWRPSHPGVTNPWSDVVDGLGSRRGRCVLLQDVTS